MSMNIESFVLCSLRKILIKRFCIKSSIFLSSSRCQSKSVEQFTISVRHALICTVVYYL